MEASNQNLIQEFTIVVFEKDELQFRDMSELKSLLPLLAYQDSSSDVEILRCLEIISLLQEQNYREWHLDNKMD